MIKLDFKNEGMKKQGLLLQKIKKFAIYRRPINNF